MLYKTVAGAITKLVPPAVAAGVAWLLATFHVVIGTSSEAAAVAWTTAALITIWAALVALIEKKYPSWAWLLGSPTADNPLKAMQSHDGSYNITSLDADAGTGAATPLVDESAVELDRLAANPDMQLHPPRQ